MLSREDRFLAKVDRRPNGCWIWTACLTVPPRGRSEKSRYGLFWNGEKLVLSHRWAYEHWREQIPDGLPLDHVVCDTPACSNPWHVEVSTTKENTARSTGVTARNTAKTHCPQGHPYDEANTWVDKTGRRHCRACTQTRSNAWQREHGAEYMRNRRASKKQER